MNEDEIRRMEESIARIHRVIADFQSVVTGWEKELAEAKDENQPEAERLDTLDVLAAVYDAWRRLDRARGPMSTTKTFRDLQERDEALDKAMVLAERHLEQEGRL